MRSTLPGSWPVSPSGGPTRNGSPYPAPPWPALLLSTLQRARAWRARTPQAAVQVATSVVIDRPAGELYRFWRSFENLPQVMPHLQSVRAIDNRHLHWVAHAPWGGSIEWRSELIDDVPERRLAWRTSDGSDVFNAGSVRFNPVADGGGPEVIVELLYVAPAGAVGATVAKDFRQGCGAGRVRRPRRVQAHDGVQSRRVARERRKGGRGGKPSVSFCSVGRRSPSARGAPPQRRKRGYGEKPWFLSVP